MGLSLSALCDYVDVTWLRASLEQPDILIGWRLHRPPAIGATRLSTRSFFAPHLGDPVAGKLGICLEENAAMAVAASQVTALALGPDTAWTREEPALHSVAEDATAHQADASLRFSHLATPTFGVGFLFCDEAAESVPEVRPGLPDHGVRHRTHAHGRRRGAAFRREPSWPLNMK
jgi:hypothetical protein